METGQIVPHYGETPKPRDHIRIVCISDTHTQTRGLQIPAGDILVHSGDFCKKGVSSEVQEFMQFLQSQRHQYKIVVSGNHDYPLDIAGYRAIAARKGLKDRVDPYAVKANLVSNCIYLEDTGAQLFGYSFWGSPWTAERHKGSFTIRDERDLGFKWCGFPDRVDILITHSPPFSQRDINSVRNEHCGCRYLADTVKRIHPKVHIFGHIHEGHGWNIEGHTTYINAAICNRRYLPVFRPIVFDLPRRE
ncbi:unnamed protein product [Blepharisma stoltei]|uniref:Calcineurin-like phosphoesterase domain-containing protein n=1 Tax=Blepharisma stoltei TaxID=1481888 RepID=A0AAU9JPC5_9CILI|nr:unnamed protein product [Blepharisma stoltei]